MGASLIRFDIVCACKLKSGPGWSSGRAGKCSAGGRVRRKSFHRGRVCRGKVLQGKGLQRQVLQEGRFCRGRFPRRRFRRGRFCRGRFCDDHSITRCLLALEACRAELTLHNAVIVFCNADVMSSQDGAGMVLFIQRIRAFQEPKPS